MEWRSGVAWGIMNEWSVLERWSGGEECESEVGEEWSRGEE